MNFEEKDGVWEAKLRCGDVVRFESEKEALAARAMYEDVQGVLGKKTIPQAATPPAHPGFPETNTMSLGVVQQRSQKKVRINIDPDVELVGIKKALA